MRLLKNPDEICPKSPFSLCVPCLFWRNSEIYPRVVCSFARYTVVGGREETRPECSHVYMTAFCGCHLLGMASAVDPESKCTPGGVSFRGLSPRTSGTRKMKRGNHGLIFVPCCFLFPSPPPKRFGDEAATGSSRQPGTPWARSATSPS